MKVVTVEWNRGDRRRFPDAYIGSVEEGVVTVKSRTCLVAVVSMEEARCVREDVAADEEIDGGKAETVKAGEECLRDLFKDAVMGEVERPCEYRERGLLCALAEHPDYVAHSAHGPYGADRRPRRVSRVGKTEDGCLVCKTEAGKCICRKPVEVYGAFHQEKQKWAVIVGSVMSSSYWDSEEFAERQVKYLRSAISDERPVNLRPIEQGGFDVMVGNAFFGQEKDKAGAETLANALREALGQPVEEDSPEGKEFDMAAVVSGFIKSQKEKVNRMETDGFWYDDDSLQTLLENLGWTVVSSLPGVKTETRSVAARFPGKSGSAI